MFLSIPFYMIYHSSLIDRKIINYNLYYIVEQRAWKTSTYKLKKVCLFDRDITIDGLPDDYFWNYNIEVEIISIDNKVMIKRY